MTDNFYRLMLVTNKGNIATDDYLGLLKRCLDAGITCVQLREKNISNFELYHLAHSVKKLTDSYRIPLIINDHVELAASLDASGVHLGQNDGNPQNARHKLGPDKLIGMSVTGYDELKKANEASVDYIGLGAIFPSSSKPDVATVWGLEGLAETAPLSKQPVIAIGGITQAWVGEVIDAGADGIAAIEAFHDLRHPGETVAEFYQIIQAKGVRDD